MNTQPPRPITSTRGAQLTGLLAVIYGFGVAFLPQKDSGFYQLWLFIGAAIVGVLFVVYLLIPFIRRVMSGDGERR